MKRRFLKPVGLIMLAVTALTAVLSGCKEKEQEVPTLPKLEVIGEDGVKVDKGHTFAINQAGGEANELAIAISGTRDWVISKPETASWLTIKPTNGPRDKSTTVTLSATENTETTRSVAIKVTATDGSVETTFNVSQKGSALPANAISIKELRALYTGSDVTISEDKVVVGTIVSNNTTAGGNSTSLKNIVIQDDEAGIAMRLAANSTFNYGEELTINVKDLTLTSYLGLIQLTKGTGTSAGVPLDAITAGTGAAPAAISITPEQLMTGDYESMYVAVSGLQFVQSAVGKKINAGGDNHASFGMETKDGDSFTVFVAKYAAFFKDPITIPEGSGVMKGLASINNGVYQILPQTAADFAGLDQPRFTPEIPEGTPITLTELRAKYTGSKVKISEDLTVTATVISNASADGGNNTSKKSIILSDGDAGITAFMASNPDPDGFYAAGDEVKLYLNGMELSEYNGLLQINPSQEKMVKTGETKVINPKAITAAQLLTGEYQSMLVSVSDVQFYSEAVGKTVNDASFRESGATAPSLIPMESKTKENFIVYVSSYSGFFATQTIPDKSGTITGIATVAGDNKDIQIMPRTAADFAGLTADRFDESPRFGVSTQEVNVSAAGGNATVDVTGNVAWTASVTEGDANLVTATPDPESGTGEGTITLNFKPNTDSENTKIVKLSVVTTAEVGTKSYEVVFTQQEAAPADALLMEDFASVTEGDNVSTDKNGTVWDGTNDNFPLEGRSTGGGSGGTGLTVYQAGGAIKLGSSKVPGFITSKELDLSTPFKVTVKVKGWTSVEGKLDITVGDVTKSITYTAKRTDAFEQATVEFEAATANSTVKIGTSAKRAFIDEVLIEKIAE